MAGSAGFAVSIVAGNLSIYPASIASIPGDLWVVPSNFVRNETRGRDSLRR